MPLFSVVIPCYNSAQYIDNCLQSILKQSYQNFEIIIVDNYSTDDTFTIIKKYANTDKRIKCFQERNGGVISHSRNFGIKKSTGLFVCFLDSDDEWHPNKLEEFSFFCTSNALIYSDMKYRFEGNRSTIKSIIKSRLLSGHFIQDLLCNGNCIYTSTVCVDRTILQEVFFDENKQLAGVEDFDLWLRILDRKDIQPIYIPKPLTYYTLGNSFSNTTKQIDRNRYILAKYIDKLSIKEKRSAISYYIENSIKTYISCGLYTKAINRTIMLLINNHDIKYIKYFAIIFFDSLLNLKNKLMDDYIYGK